MGDKIKKIWLHKLVRLVGGGILRGLAAAIGAALVRWLLGIL
ncbi:hypothetical protein [Streptomyces sp. B3I8]|nr:hypothetical protein [Streptomyces sp. B3I8]MDQ0789196.1 hypothetical protein [Streptomyces sp. B3I8]